MDKKIKAIIITVLLALALLTLIVWALYSFAMSLETVKLAVWAIAATLLLPCVFLSGFWFGKTEVRGFLSGFDASLDKLARAVDFRDNARVTTSQRMTKEPEIRTVVLPTVPPMITHRAASTDEVIDL